jgi:hypothetical protein
MFRFGGLSGSEEGLKANHFGTNVSVPLSVDSLSERTENRRSYTHVSSVYRAAETNADPRPVFASWRQRVL